MIWSEIVAKKTSLKILANEKHSSLFVRSVIDNEKKVFLKDGYLMSSPMYMPDTIFSKICLPENKFHAIRFFTE